MNNKKQLVSNYFGNLIFPIVPFEVTNKMPQHVKAIFKYQMREVFRLRREYLSRPLDDASLDLFLENYWANHWTIIKACSERPEWDWDNFALIHSKDVAIQPKFLEARRDLVYFLNACTSSRCKSNTVTSTPHFSSGISFLKIPELAELILSIYDEYIFEGLSEKSTKHTPHITLESVRKAKDYYTQQCPIMEVERGGKTIKLPKFQVVFGAGIGKLPDTLLTSHLDDFLELFNNNKELFKAELLKYAGACQTTELNGLLTGVSKATFINKLVQLYFRFVCVKLNFVGSAINFPDSLLNTSIDKIYDWLTNSDYKWVSNNPFKIRLESVDGYQEVACGSFNQMFTRIIEEVSGTTSQEQFIVSLHPCDMITCSFGYNWSSCQSFINIFDNFPRGYGQPGNGTSTYSGCHHGGNFNFLQGNGFVVYIPYKEEYPLFLAAKKKRMIMWVNNDLTAMRQNCFYPGKPRDPESIALATSIRVYLQNVFAHHNNTKGTSDWIAASGDKSQPFSFNQTSPVTYIGYTGEPVFKISYVKDRQIKDIKHSSPVYALDVAPCEESVLNRRVDNNRFVFCKRDGLPVTKPKTVMALNNLGVQVKLEESMTMVVNDNLVVSLAWYKENYKMLKYRDGKLLYNSKKYIDATGIHYVLELPETVAQCPHCQGYFDKSLLIEGYCLTCAASQGSLEINTVKSSFIKGELSLEFNEYSLNQFFRLFDPDSGIKWKSGKNLREYIPTLPDRVIINTDSGVILKSKSINVLPVHDLSKSFAEVHN